MATKITDPMGKESIRFWKSQGVRFVDIKTGKEIDGEEENESKD